MESIMPVLVVLYFLATIVAAIIKKARTPPRQSRPIPGQLEELFDLPVRGPSARQAIRLVSRWKSLQSSPSLVPVR